MTVNTIVEAVVGTFHADNITARPVRVGVVTGYALASLICLGVMDRAADEPTSSTEQRQAMVLQAIADAERMLGRTLGTNLEGYFAISRQIIGVMREWPSR